MNLKLKIFKNLLPFLASFLMLFQSLAPAGVVLAQEVSSPTPEASPVSESADPSPSDQPTVSPTPADSPSPLDESPQPSVVPSESPAPSDQPSDSSSSSQTDQATPNTSDANSDNQSPSPPPSPKPDIKGDEHISVDLVSENNGTLSPTDLFGQPYAEPSAYLSTDKADYSPTEAAVISGSGFSANTTYTLVITSSDPPAVNFSTDITTNSEGTFTYTYQLDGNYRPNYKVEVKDSTGTVVATTTFTDSVIPDNKVGISMFGFAISNSSDYSTVGGQPTGVGELKNGQVGDYPEGACIPIEIEVENKDNSAGDIIVSPIFDYFNGVVGVQNLETMTTGLSGNPKSLADNLNDFNYSGSALTSTTSFIKSSGGTVSAAISGPYSGNNAGTSGTTGTDVFRHYNVTLSNVPAGDTVYMIFCSRLGVDASQYSGGASLSIRTAQGGAENIPIPVNQILVLPSITLTKVVSGGSATADQWTFNVSPAISGVSSYPIPSSQSSVTINNVSPDGNYTITESGPVGYSFSSGSGTSCTFTGSTATATATVAAGKPPTNASCTFTNVLATGTLKVIKTVVSDNGGNATASNFNLHVKSGGTDVSGSPAAGSATGTAYTLNTGTYLVSEDIPPTGYTQTGLSGNCNSSGSVTVVAGTEVTCTITNNDNAPSLTLVKVVSGGTSVASDWTLTASGPTGFSGLGPTVNNGVSFDAGTYDLSESGPSDYSASNWVCTGGGNQTDGNTVEIGLGENVTCTITNSRNTGTIELKKAWSGTGGQTTLNIGTSAGGTQTASVQTGANGGAPLTTGTQTVNTGTYYVSETGGLTNYTSSLACTDDGSPVIPGASNSLSVASNHDVICTFTNTRNTGSVKVNKLVDADGNGTYEGGNTEANTLGFDWGLDSETPARDMGTTATGVNTGSHSVTEDSVTDYHFVGWYPTNDTSGKSCSNPTATTLPASISVTNGQTTEITLCNAINTGTVVVHKDVQGPSGGAVTDTSNNFTVQLDSANSQTITDDGTVTYNNVVVGSHTVTESVVATGYTLYGISETQGTAGNTGGLSINVANGQTTHVYVTNRQNTGTVTVIKDVLDPDGGAVSDSHPFTANLNPGSQSDSFAEGDSAVFTVNPGTYTVTEDDDLNYDEMGCKLVTGAEATNFNVSPGGQVTVTCTNKQIKATIDVVKDVISPTGGAVSDNHTFTAQLNGGNDQSFSEATAAAYLVNPGSYSITELSDNNYDYVSCTPDADQTPGNGAQVILGSNDSVTVTCTNKQKNAQVTVVKDVRDPNGADVADSTNFVVQRDGSGTDDKTFREGLNADYTLPPGTYTFAELVTAGYTLNSINPDNDASVGNGTTVTLNSGQNLTITFTNYQNAGSISGQKFGDTDGVLGTTDDQPNLVNWVIELWTCSSDFLSCSFLTSDTTDSGGYSFLNLVPGYYQVREVLQGGWTALSSLFHNVTVSPGENETGKNFVNFENVSVTACKVTDADGNPNTTNDRTPKSGWEVNLLTDGNVTDTQDTVVETGCYTWSDLGPGYTYGVSEETPTGWAALSDTTHSFGQAESREQYSYTFVNTEYGKIIIEKQTDPNGDSQSFDFTADYDIDGFALTDGQQNDSGNLLPGTYSVTETVPGGWDLTSAVCDDRSDPSSISLQAGETVTCTFTNSELGKIQGRKFHDLNNDGNRDSGESYLDDWTIRLYEKDGTNWNFVDDFLTGDTGVIGQYKFENLAINNYKICEVLESGWTQSSPTGVANNEQSDEAPRCRVPSIDVAGRERTGLNFGNVKYGSISGTKYEDYDGNGSRSEGENGLETWTIELKDGSDAVLQSTTTDSNGDYQFSNLLPGAYKVCEILQPGWLQTSSPQCYDITVSGDDHALKDFGNQGLGTIIVEKNVEPDSDATFEFKIEGSLIETIGFVLGDEESTDPDYAGLPAGTYSVSETSDELYTTTVECVSDQEDEEVADSLDLDPGETITCTFTNTRDMETVTIHKKVDDGSNTYQTGDSGANTLGFRWGLDEGDNNRLMGTSEIITTGEKHDVDENSLSGYVFTGWYENLGERTEFSCTNPESTDLPISLTVTKDSTRSFTLCNQLQLPTLTISKSNNAAGDKGPGDSVLYTITVSLSEEGGSAEDVTMTDLLPGGFTYVAGSWTSDSDVRGDLKAGGPTTEPTYASPGDWILGDMVAGETVTLTLLAKISDGQEPGLYKDVAWAQGTAADSSTVLALAIDPGDLDSGDSNFVGTDVNIVKDTQNSASVNVVREEQVLGAKTELPATGPQTIWLELALAGLTFGTGLVALGFRLRRKHA